MVIRRAIYLFLLVLWAAPLSLAQAQTSGSSGPMPMPTPPMAQGAQDTAKAAQQPLGDVDLILFDQQRLFELREYAIWDSPQWRRLITWCLDPARQNIDPADGPGLALAAMVLKQRDPATSQRLARLAVRCLLEGARFSKVESADGRTIIDGGLPWKPSEVTKDGYDLVAPFGADTALRIDKITTTKLYVEKGGPDLKTLMKRGQAYHLLTSDVRRASMLVEHTALTFKWTRDMLHPDERRDIADWLRAQAMVFAEDGRGCFGTDSAAVLKIMALAGRAGLKDSALAAGLVQAAYTERFLGIWEPALENAGQGGAWFGGTYAGAMAGWDLAMFAAAVPPGDRRGKVLGSAWFNGRQGALVNSLLPETAQALGGSYRGVCPSGDNVISSSKAAELVRMQMLLFRSLMPGAPLAQEIQAMLLSSDAPAMTQGQHYYLDFLLLDILNPGKAMAVAPLDYLAQGAGRAYSRSGWTPWDTLVAFNCGPHFSLPQHLDAGSVQIFNNGPLLARGGAYDGPATKHAMNYAARSIAHNTLVIFDPTEYSWYDMRAGQKPRGTYANDGGQRAWAYFDEKGRPLNQAPWTASGYKTGPAPWADLMPIYKAANINVYDSGPRFAYFRGDMTSAYRGSSAKARLAVRHLIHLRPGGPDDATAAEAIVLVDEVVLARPELDVKAVFHFAMRPFIESEMQTEAPGRAKGQASRLRASNGKSVLWIASLQEQPEEVTLIGGPAQDWVDGKAYPPQPPAKDPAPWRVELTPTGQEGPTRKMVHVLLPLPGQNESPPTLSRLHTADENLAGLVIHDRQWPRVVAVRLGGEASGQTVSYEYPEGRSRHLVAGLAPGVEYAITTAGQKVSINPGKGLAASAGGVLAFKLVPAEDDQAKTPPAQQPSADE